MRLPAQLNIDSLDGSDGRSAGTPPESLLLAESICKVDFTNLDWPLFGVNPKSAQLFGVRAWPAR